MTRPAWLSRRVALLGGLGVVVLLATSLGLWLVDAGDSTPRTVRVGVYENAPKIYHDRNGVPDGLFIQLLREIARQEDWRLIFVPCEWARCLEQLSNGELDLMPDVAISEERRARFDYHATPVAHSWSQVFTHPDAIVLSPSDLAGQRIAVLRAAVQVQPLERILATHEVDHTLVSVDSLIDGFEAVLDGRADAVVSNSFFAGRHNVDYGLRETPIVFNPASLYFAVAKGRNGDLLEPIDHHLRLWRQDTGSIYYEALKQTMAEPPRVIIPHAVRWGLAIVLGLLLLFMLMSVSLRWQVRQRTAQLSFLTHHDQLTELPNRVLLYDRLDHALQRARREETLLALLLVDLDRFRNVNDTLGHLQGDALLQQVAQRMGDVIRPGDTLARVGGDEFMLLLEDLTGVHQVSAMAHKLLQCLPSHLPIADHQPMMTGSLGISLYPTDGRDIDTLVKHAELALYEAKHKGRNTFCFFDAALSAGVLERLELETALRGAIARNELLLHYQPQIDMASGRMVGVEALVRWQRPGVGLVPPGVFIPLAEESGLIVDIGNWVLLEACRQMMDWERRGLWVARVAVNLSVPEIKEHVLVEQVAGALRESGLAGERLELEVTESTIMHDPDQAAVILNDLKALGVSLAVDDFGTGYSGLAYLKRLPLDRLKIDRSFVQDIGASSSDEAICRAVIGLARSLGLDTVAEGVERREQVDFLRHEGCEIGQGYLYGRPVSAEDFQAARTNDARVPGVG